MNTSNTSIEAVNFENELVQILNRDIQPKDSMVKYKKQNFERINREKSVFMHFLDNNLESTAPNHSTSEIVGFIEQATKKLNELENLN